MINFQKIQSRIGNEQSFLNISRMIKGYRFLTSAQ